MTITIVPFGSNSNELTLAAGDTLSNAGTISGVTGAVLGAGAIVENSGEIAGTSVDGVDLGASGQVTNLPSGIITGAATGILDGAGGIIGNAGKITGFMAGGVAVGADSSVSNTGTIVGGTAGVTGGATTTVYNSGVIDGLSTDGVSLGASSVITNAASGTISGGDSGLAEGATVILVNSGSIVGTSANGVTEGASGTITNNVTGIIGGGASGIVGGASNVVMNAGAIAGTTADAISLGASAIITNAIGGTISGGMSGIVGGASGTVTNSGNITGSAGDGISFAATGMVTNLSGATISGAIDGVDEAAGSSVVNNGVIAGLTGDGVDLSSSGTVVNAGTISGGNGVAVYLGGTGVNLLVVDPGAVFNGQVVGSATAMNTLELGAGTSLGVLSGLGTEFINFGAIAVDAGAQWVVDGPLDLPLSEISFGVGSSLLYNGVQYGTPQCFVAGTAIATPLGNVAVETLRIGDVVTLDDGGVAPVFWVGHKTIAPRFADPLKVVPIRIRAGALDDGLPERDLLVSPCHAVLVDGLLIQAAALVNGVSIVRETKMPGTFTYYHIELGTHSLLLAEGVPSETLFADSVDRMEFDNWAEHEALFGTAISAAEMSYPRVKAARQVPRAIRFRLAARYGGNVAQAA